MLLDQDPLRLLVLIFVPAATLLALYGRFLNRQQSRQERQKLRQVKVEEHSRSGRVAVGQAEMPSALENHPGPAVTDRNAVSASSAPHDAVIVGQK